MHACRARMVSGDGCVRVINPGRAGGAYKRAGTGQREFEFTVLVLVQCHDNDHDIVHVAPPAG